jgi:hypothetical protein
VRRPEICQETEMAEWVYAGLVGLVFAVAGVLVPEPWLPWVLIGAGALLAWTGTEKLSELSTHWTRPQLKWIKDALAREAWRRAIVAVLVLAVIAITRFVFFQTIELQRTALQAVLPGEDVKLTGSGFPTEHPKILTAMLEPKGTSGPEREAINKGVAGNVFTVGLPADLDPGEYELVVEGALPILANQERIDLRVLGAPEITGLTPAAGFPAFGGIGTRVVIRGKNFDLRNHGSANRVFFGDAVTVARAGDAQECGEAVPSCLVAFVPGETPDGTVVNLTVETSSSSSRGKSNPVPFHVLGPPAIDQAALAGLRGFARTASFPGTEVTIKGHGFYPAALDDPGAMTVTIGGKRADIVKPPSETAVTVRIPADVRDGRIEIATKAHGGSTATGSIEILGPPEIKDWKQGAAAPGETIELFGSGFDVGEKDNNRVTIGGAAAKVTGARIEGEMSVLSVTVPGLAESGELAVETPAGATRASGFQVTPIIDNIEPKKRYIGDTVFVHGRGIFKEAAAWTNHEPNLIPMRQTSFAKSADGQVAGFVVPAGAETSPITLRQGEGATAVSHDNLIIDRITELQQRRIRLSRPITIATAKATVELQVSCDDGLIAKGNFPGSPVKLAVGRCPIDLDVDRSSGRAYTANVQGDAKEGISEIDVSNPMAPKFVRHIDSGGANPTRVRILHGGGLVAATKQGIYSGDAGKGLNATGVSGPVVAMLGDPQEGQFVTVVLQAPARAAVFSREGRPRIVSLKENPKSAALAGNKVYVVNYGSDDLSAFYPRTPDKLIRIGLKPGAAPFDLASRFASYTGHDELYVTETKLQQIAAIDTRKDVAVEFPAPVTAAALVAFSPDGCVAVVYDPDKRAFAKIDPKRRSVFDSIQYLPDEVSPPPIALRVDAALWVSLVLSDGTIETPYQASCPR